MLRLGSLLYCTISVWLLCCYLPVESKMPGLKVSLHKSFFEAGTAVALQELHDYVKTVCFPDCNNCGAALRGTAGFFDYRIWDLCVRDVTIHTQRSYVVPKPPTGLRAWLDAALRIGGKWKIEGLWGAFECDGGVDVTGQITAGLNMQVTRAADGRPHVTAPSSYANVFDMDVDLHGSLCADILQLLADWLKATVSGRLEDAIEDMLKGVLMDKTNNFLHKMEVDVEFGHAGDGIFLDYTLASNPVAAPSTYEVDLNAEVYYKGHMHDPKVPMPIEMGPVTDSHGRMVCMKADAQATINQITYAGQLTNEMMLSSSELEIGAVKDFMKCNCSGDICLIDLMPQLKGHCGPTNEVTMSVESIATGEAVVAADGVLLAFHGRLNISSAEETLVSVVGTQNFALADIGLTGTPGGANITVLFAVCNEVGSSYALAHSSIGTISQGAIDAAAKATCIAIQAVFAPALHTGIPLPNFKEYIMYANPVATFGNRTLTLCLDLKYTG